MAAPSRSGNQRLQNYPEQLMFPGQQNKKRLIVEVDIDALMEYQEELPLKDRPLSRSSLVSARSDICHGFPTPQTKLPSALLPPTPQMGHSATTKISSPSFPVSVSTYKSASPSDCGDETQPISRPESMDSRTTAGTFEGQYPETPDISFLEEDEFSQFGPGGIISEQSVETIEGQYPSTPDAGFLENEFSDFGQAGVILDSPNSEVSMDSQITQGYSLHSEVSKQFSRDVHGTSTSVNQESTLLRAEMLKCNPHSTYVQVPTLDNIFCPVGRAETHFGPSSPSSALSLACDQRQSDSSSIMSGSSSQTSSCLFDNDTDWGDDESDADILNAIHGSGQIRINSTGGELPVLATAPVLSKMKQELVDRIMVQFWEIFNQDKETNLYEDTISHVSCSQHSQESEGDAQEGSNFSQTTTSSTNSGIQNNGTSSTVTQNGKRKRQDQDENENNEGENGSPKRPKNLLSPPQNTSDTRKFACPYRKHDARKYCVRNWRSCALTPLETVARVKGHLYRHHRIFPCQRCKKLFRNQQEVNEHLKEAQGCALIEGVQHDGLTSEAVERLRSKKKTHREQTEEERWVEIYNILFPGDIVPSPFFEEIQEDTILSPDSQELADYEEYCRRELPRVFRASLEVVVNKNTQPLEEQLRSQLMDLIRDAQDQVFHSYRSSSSTTNTRTPPTKSTPSSSPATVPSSSSSQGSSASPVKSQPTIINSADSSHNPLPPFLQSPSPQSYLQPSLDISNQSTRPSLPGRHARSDSGYDSGSFGLPSTQPLELGEFTVNDSASNLQASSLPEMNKGTANHPSSSDLTQANSAGITTDGIGHLNSEFLFSANNLDFSFDFVDLSEFDKKFPGNYDFSQNFDDWY